MHFTITTTITTTVDVETFKPDHKVAIDSSDDLPTEVIMSAVAGACKATLNTISKENPRILREEVADDA